MPRRQDDRLVPPEWLAALLTAEGTTNPDRLTRPLQARGVLSLSHEGPDSSPTAITFNGPRIRGGVPVNPADPQPVTDALRRLAAQLVSVDTLMRLRLAAKDMEDVATCAREIARTRRDPDSHDPYAPVEPILEAGLVVVYARSFTGKASLGERWRPTGDDADLHSALMAARGHIYAHADHTAHRSLVDTRTLLGTDGAPTLAIAATRLHADVLDSIADMCARQEERFRLAADAIQPDAVEGLLPERPQTPPGQETQGEDPHGSRQEAP